MGEVLGIVQRVLTFFYKISESLIEGEEKEQKTQMQTEWAQKQRKAQELAIGQTRAQQELDITEQAVEMPAHHRSRKKNPGHKR